MLFYRFIVIVFVIVVVLFWVLLSKKKNYKYTLGSQLSFSFDTY